MRTSLKQLLGFLFKQGRACLPQNGEQPILVKWGWINWFNYPTYFDFLEINYKKWWLNKKKTQINWINLDSSHIVGY